MLKKRVILGLDVSTTCIGCCILECDGGTQPTILKLTHILPKVDKNIKGIEALILKKNLFESEFLSKYSSLGITDVVIEEPLLCSNNVNTVSTLLRFSALISDSVYKTLNIVPNYMSSYDARKYSFPELLSIRKTNKKGVNYPINDIKKALKNNSLVMFGDYPWDIDKKHVMWNKITEIYPDIEWVYNNKNELKKENFDASDSLVCALAFDNLQNYGEINELIHSSFIDGGNINYVVKIWDKFFEKSFSL